MGKKIKYANKEVDEELSDLEMETGEGNSGSESDETPEINEKEQLEIFSKTIKNDFAKMFKAKGRNSSWLETMDIISDQAIDANLNTDDDIKRELIFYNIAVKNAIRGINKLKEAGEKINRPEDFYAEMIKSDVQMTRVKKQIIEEQQRIKKFEAKKQKLHNIKFAKISKDKQTKDKANYKKKTMEGVKEWQKHVKTNPNDYNKLDEFLDDKKRKGHGDKFRNKFGRKKGDMTGMSTMHKSRDRRERDFKHFQKKQKKRPGKIKRMINRNKKNSKRNK